MFKLSLLLVVLMPVGALASKGLEERVKMLEKRIEQLERAQSGSNTTRSTSGLKVKDMEQREAHTGYGRNVAGTSGMPAMTKEQQEEITKQIQLFKERQIESQKILDELMKEP